MLRAARILLIASLLCRPSVAAPDKPRPETPVPIGIVFDRSTRTEPELDEAPRVRSGTPIELVPDLARRLGPDPRGRVRLDVDETGAVKQVHAAGGTLDSDIAEFLEVTLAAWVFESPLRGGRPTPVTFGVIFAPLLRTTAADSVDADGLASPIAVYLVPPAYPAELLRTRYSAASGWAHGYEAASTTFYTMTRDPGTGRTISTPITRTVPVPDPTQFGANRGSAATPFFAGYVVLSLTADERGVVHDPVVIASSCSAFEPAAVAAILRWHFPATPGVSGMRPRWREVVRFAAPDKLAPSFIRRHKRASWDDPPAFQHLAIPVHPRSETGKHRSGTAEALVRLNKHGRVTSIESVRSDHPEFAGALRAAVLASSFAPARHKGQPVDAALELTARFSTSPASEGALTKELPALRLPAPPGSPALSPADIDRVPERLCGRAPVFAPEDLAGADRGSVTLEVTIDENGRVCDPEIIKASHAPLAYAALQACSTWLFEPPTAKGIPVSARVRVPIGMSAPAPN